MKPPRPGQVWEVTLWRRSSSWKLAMVKCMVVAVTCRRDKWQCQLLVLDSCMLATKFIDRNDRRLA